MFKSQDIHCLVLAAGSARRYGSAKLLHRLDDGRSILQHTLGTYTELFDQVTVICNDNLRLIDQAIAAQALVKVNPLSHVGMSESIKLGISSIAPKIACLIVLADMPYVTSDSISRICQLVRANNMVQALVDAQPGNPVAIGADFLPELMQLQGDVGAKAILQKYPLQVVNIELSDNGLVHDIDTLDDLR